MQRRHAVAALAALGSLTLLPGRSHAQGEDAVLNLPAGEAVARIKKANDEVHLVRLRNGQPPSVWTQVNRSTLEQL